MAILTLMEMKTEFVLTSRTQGQGESEVLVLKPLPLTSLGRS